MAGKDAAALAKMDPEFEELLKTLTVIPRIIESDIPTLRRMLSERMQGVSPTQRPEITGVREENMIVPARDGYQIPIRVYKPETQPSDGSPLIIFYHGGGFCLGGLETEEMNCRLFANKLGAVCVNVDYRLAPEHPFPTPINDSWDAFKWTATNAGTLGADPSKGFIVGGTSAGGNISVVIGILARDEKLSPPLTGLCLLVPALMDWRAIPEEYKSDIVSYEQNKDAPVLGMKSVEIFMGAYKADIHSSLYNVFTPPANHANLPPTYLQICGMDPLRDEAVIFERRLRDNGTKTKIDVYPGVPHNFWTAFPTMNLSKKFIQDTVNGVEWLLRPVKT